MSDQEYKLALELVERLMNGDPDPTSLLGKALNALTDLIVDYEKDIANEI